MAAGNEIPKPPAEELTDTPAPARKAREAVRAAVAAPRKSVLIINDDNDIRTYSGLGSMSGDVVKQNNRTTSNRNFCKIGIISSISRI